MGSGAIRLEGEVWFDVGARPLMRNILSRKSGIFGGECAKEYGAVLSGRTGSL